MQRTLVLSVLAMLIAGFFPAAAAAAPRPPNVVIILADDLGFGDTGAYGASRVQTPNIDRLAREGLRFTDAHSAAATCTPSRYAMLTGEYAWRKKGTGVLPGNAPLIIDPGRPTLASMFRRAGYRTAAVGKWHLGLGPASGPDWNGDIKPGPLELGFDYSFILPATGDRVPCVYVENHRVVGLDPADPIVVDYAKPIEGEPTGKANPGLLKVHPSHGHDMTIVNGISRIGYMRGGKAARWVDEDIADVITKKAVSFIEASKDRPFFLYFATHDIHVPRVPNARFVGKTDMGPRGDVIVQFDWSTGQILETLERLKLTNDTIVILTSDNGPVVDDGYRDDAREKLGNHRPAGPLRGGKYSAFEGGTRVPFVVRWPARVKPGVSDALVCHVDFMASFARLTGQAPGDGAGPDTADVLPALLGESKTGRVELVEQAGVLSLREGTVKYIEPGKGAKYNANTNTETGQDPDGQLFDLSTDLGETKNLAPAQAEKVKSLDAKLKSIREKSSRR